MLLERSLPIEALRTTNTLLRLQSARLSTRHAFFVVAGRLKVRRRAYGLYDEEPSGTHTLSPNGISKLSRRDLQTAETALLGTKRTSKSSEIVIVLAGIQMGWATLKLAQGILTAKETIFSPQVDIDLIAYTFWGSVISLTWALVRTSQLCKLTRPVLSSSHHPVVQEKPMRADESTTHT